MISALLKTMILLGCSFNQLSSSTSFFIFFLALRLLSRRMHWGPKRVSQSACIVIDRGQTYKRKATIDRLLRIIIRHLHAPRRKAAFIFTRVVSAC